MIAGIEGIQESKWTRTLRERIGDVDHIVFVIIDGLGLSILERLPESSFLRSSMAMELRAVTPSTTACAITAFATGLYPSQSGIAGWYTHLPEHRLTATVLPFEETASGTPLQDLGIAVESVFPQRVLMPQMRHTPLSIMPEEISDSATSRHLRGETEAIGYSSISEAIDYAIAAAAKARSTSYTYLYLHHVDTLSHEVGPEEAEVDQLSLLIDGEIQRLSRNLGRDTRLVVTADHGQIAVPLEKRYLLPDEDPFIRTLRFPPTGETRFPVFHVSADQREEFAALFHDRFSESFVLLTLGDAEKAGLYGPGKIEARLRPRFGDFVGIAKDNAIIGYLPPGESLEEKSIGRHGGLSHDEMCVPLIIV